MVWQKHLREGLLETNACRVPAPDGRIKLDSMENPHTWPAEMRDQWLAELATVDVNRYPDSGGQELKQQLRAVYGIADHCGVLLGNGSDELIQIVLAGFARPDACVLSTDPAFVVYGLAAKSYGSGLVSVALDENFQIDLSTTLAEIETHQPAVIFLAYPNNPTGNLFKVADIQKIINIAPGVVVIDEAYQPFAGATWLDDLADLPDKVLVMRTLSKFGLAGVRMGYLAGNAGLIEELEKVCMPYNIKPMSLVTARFAVENHHVFEQQADGILRERASMEQVLGAFPLLRRFPSNANFFLIKAEGYAQQLFEHLLETGIRVKNLVGVGTGEALKDCLRFTVGARTENDSLLAALAGYYPKIEKSDRSFVR